MAWVESVPWVKNDIYDHFGVVTLLEKKPYWNQKLILNLSLSILDYVNSKVI